jgi:hypothetical protein
VDLLINGTYFISDQETVLSYRTLLLSLSRGNPNEFERIRHGLVEIVCEGPKESALLGCYVLGELAKSTEILQLTEKRTINALFEHLFSTDNRLRNEATELLCVTLQYSNETSYQISKKVISVLTENKSDSTELVLPQRFASKTAQQVNTNEHISGVARLISRLIERGHDTAGFLIDANVHLLLFDAVIEQNEHNVRNNGEVEYMVDTIKELCNVLRKILKRKDTSSAVEQSIEKAIGRQELDVILGSDEFEVEMLLRMQDTLCEQEGDRYIHHNQR